MARIVVRSLASLCFLLGAVALFISFQGGTVRLGLPGSGATETEGGYILALPNAMAMAVPLLILSVVCFVLSKKLGRNRSGEEPKG